MLKIRIEGTQDEIDRFLDNFKDYYQILWQSRHYKEFYAEGTWYNRVFIGIDAQNQKPGNPSQE
ncbi:MAG: DUF3970 family protein [Bacillota bacterium]